MKKNTLTIILVLSLMVISGCTKSVATDSSVNYEPVTIVEETTTAEPETETDPPFEPVSIDVMMVGDILAHEGVYHSGYFPDGTVNFDHLFANITDEIQSADISIVNQEVMLGGIELGLSGYPCFNSPTELGDALVNAGFNVVLHATNHALDKGAIGVDNTLNFWKTKHPEINVLGIHDADFTDYETRDICVYEQDGLRIAILNYTYGTNGIPFPQGRPLIVNLLDEEKVAQDVTRAKEIADFVIVCPHWGTEYVYNPDSYQKNWTKIFYDLGVDLVIGTHPHVIEPVEWIKSEENDHRMLVYYSLGNFVSNQDRLPRMLGAMAKITITMDKAENVDPADKLILGGETKTIRGDENIIGTKEGDELVVYISDYSVIPLVTHKLFGPGLITTYKLDDYTDELAAKNRINSDEPGFSVAYLKDLANRVFGDLYPIEGGNASSSENAQESQVQGSQAQD
ncbi:MAG: CapA family protein [Lachnospiraceae bacterium]